MKLSKLLLRGALIVLMITSFPVSGFAGSEQTSSPDAAARGKGGAGEAAVKPDPLVIYAEAFAIGIVLDYTKAEGFSEWSEPYSLEELDGLVWTLSGKDGDGEEQSFGFKLVLMNNTLVMSYPAENEGGDGEEDPIEVYFTTLADNDLTATEEKEIELLYISSGSLTKMTGKTDESGELGLRARVMQPSGANGPVPSAIIINIPEDFLILYADYEAALEVSKDTSYNIDDTDDQDNDKDGDGVEEGAKDVPESDKLLRELIGELELSNELRTYSRDKSARIVLDVTYDVKTSAWILDKDSMPEVVPSGYEAMDTSNRTLIMVGLIAIMGVCFVSLGMSVLLVIKKSRR